MNQNIKFLIDNQRRLKYHLNCINKRSSDNDDILQEFNEKFILYALGENEIKELSFKYLQNGIRNTLIDRKRRNKVKKGLNEPTRFEFTEKSFGAASCEQQSEEKKINLEDALTKCKLTNKERRVVLLYVFEDKSQKEIAKSIGMNYVTFRGRLRKAKEKLVKHKKKFENLFDITTCVY